jgi:cysteine desulfurase family protein (TIGR01976 family)
LTGDVARIRGDFPALDSGVAFFDGPGGTQTPRVVGEVIASALTGPLSNRGTQTVGAQNAERFVVECRAACGRFLRARPEGIVFGRSATQLTYDLSRAISATWSPGDVVAVTRLDHDANVRPWVQAAARVGAGVHWIDVDPETSELADLDLPARTRVVAVTGASNLIGTRPPLARITSAAHASGALVWVDGVHRAAHTVIDLTALDVDLFVCSPYKFLGPHHGVLAAKPEVLESLRIDKLLPATDVSPERFELGTLPYELLAGTTAAITYLEALGMPAIEAHEDRLRRRIEEGIAAIGGITCWSRARDRTPTLLLTFDDGRSCNDVSAHLASRGIAAPSGSFYALEPSRRLGLGDAGGLRIGLAPYNNDEDVTRLLEALASASS